MEQWMWGRWRPFMQPDGAGGASGNEGDAATAQEGQADQDVQEGQAQKPLTFDDLLAQNRDYQAEFDRRTAKALETARQKAEAEAKERERKAAERAKLTAEEKAEQDLRDREAAVAAGEANVLRRELTADAKSRLVDKGLDPSLAGLLNYSSREAWEESLQLVEATIPEMLQADRKKQMAGTPPVAGPVKPLTDPSAMTMTEKMRLKSEDPAQYKKLFGGK